MLNDFTGADQVYIACGYTDLRKGIDGLARLVQQQFELDPFTNTLFLFCGRRRDRIKGLYWEKDGFILLYKRLEQGAYQCLADLPAHHAQHIRQSPRRQLGRFYRYGYRAPGNIFINQLHRLLPWDNLSRSAITDPHGLFSAFDGSPPKKNRL